MTDLAEEFDRLAREVDPAEPSTVHWRPLEDLLAEELGLEPEQVYFTTVSKAGNVRPRFRQSDAAEDAEVVVAMCPDVDTDELGRIVAGAEDRAERQGRMLVLVAADLSSSWRVEAVVKRAADPVPPSLAAAWPQATVLSIQG